MKLTKLSIAIGVSALALGTSAFAAQTGYFAGVNLGYGITRADNGSYHFIDSNFIVSPTSNDGVAYGINGGYNFNNYFGVEAQANRDANDKENIYLHNTSSEYSAVGQQTSKFYDVDILADGYYPVGHNFGLVGKAGFAYVKENNSGTSVTNPSLPVAQSTHFYRPKLVAGVSYAAMENVSVSATYSRIFEQGNANNNSKYLPNLDVAALAVDYSF